MILQPEQKLKQIRELKNLSQEYIANQLGLSVRAYSKIETGETQLTINRLNEISRIMGTSHSGRWSLRRSSVCRRLQQKH